MATTRPAAPTRRRPTDRSCRRLARRPIAALAASIVAAASVLAPPLGIGPAAPVAHAAGLASGFVDETTVDGLMSPTAIVFAPDGRVFVAEKRGIVKTWPALADFDRNDPPIVALDIRTDVMNFWDRGLLGMAVDPAWPAQPYLYVLYTYDAPPGLTAPHWNAGDPNADPCPNPPGATTDGCPVTTHLERVTMNPATGLATARSTLLGGWCQQFPSHSAGSVAFGLDGMLYVSGGEGANFNGGTQDFGQYGGTLPDTTDPVTPRNPCGDPPAGVGGTMTAPTAEGGALRAQSFRRAAGEAAVLNGAVLRLDPATGDAAAGNAAIGNADPIRRRIVGYGFRNPYRMTFRPGTNDLYVGDVGHFSWEEVDRLGTPTGGPTNFGWPCIEGPKTGTYYTTVSLDLCSSLSAASTASPFFAYPHAGHMASGDGCPPVDPATTYGASISGLAFYTGTTYPALYRGGLFLADYARNCIVALPDRGDGVPSTTAVPFSSTADSPVMLTTDPDGDLVYVAFTSGTIHRIRYQAPVAAFTATPDSGIAPLHVAFDAGGSSAPAGITAYDWDFGDGSAHGTGVTVDHTYLTGTWTARLTVTDANGATATASRTIAASNTAPVVTLDKPTCTTGCWSVGDVIALAAHATDAEDGPLPASAFSWHVGLEHCQGPGDCHEHELTAPSGVTSASVVGPDHDADSFLRVTVTVTDSGGLSDSASIDVAPRLSSLRVVSSPAGLPVTLDGVTGSGSVGPTAEIVGHVATVSAPSTATSGGDVWAFGSWSDGGASSHTVTTGDSPATLTATFTRLASDVSNTCAGAPVITPTGRWTSGQFAPANDVDWVRFKVSTAGTYRLVLGNLPVDGVMTLYSGCSSVIASSNQAGRHWEEIVASLGPGTYGVRMSSVGGASSPSSYVWLAQRLTAGAALISSRTVPSTSVRLVGEVLNTTAGPRSVTVTARLYSASGALLKTVSAHPLFPVLAARARSPFLIVTARPAGFASVRYTVTSSAASRPTPRLYVSGLAASAPSAGLWRVTGMVVNTTTTTATHVADVVAIYDAVGRVTNATAGHPSSTTLAPGQRAGFVATFSGVTTAPAATLGRGRAS